MIKKNTNRHSLRDELAGKLYSTVKQRVIELRNKLAKIIEHGR